MKINKITFFNTIFLSLFLSFNCFGQNLSLTDLHNICNKTNWEYVNQFMMNKGWEYSGSKKGNSEKYSTIIWSLNKSYDEKAEGWFHLYTYENFPNKINYSVFNKPAYTKIQKSLNSNGYKLTNNKIEDNEIISTYKNSKFILKITTEKREKKDNYSFEKSITAYDFLLIKKSSVYDTDNGKKINYFENGLKNNEYTLLNGKIEGKIRTYHKNGKLKKEGYFKNDKGNGKFIEYDEDGKKSSEYYMKNNLYNGTCVNYFYRESSNELIAIKKGNYFNDKKNGKWDFYIIDDKNEKLLNYTNYKNGIKDGSFQKVKNDSLIIGNYKNDKLNGEYRIYIDLMKMAFGGIIETNINKLNLISHGKYFDEQKSGLWKHYGILGSLRSEGKYLYGKKEGEWKYYYGNYSNSDGEQEPFSKKLYLIQNYKSDKLNGLAKRFSYLNKEKYKCSKLDKNNKPIDSCTRMVYEKLLELSNYKNDKLDGDYELRDSINELIAKGNFRNDLKIGKWFHKFSDLDFNNNSYNYFMEGSYENNKREGKWIMYYKKGEINQTINYYNDELNGELIEWNKNNKPNEIKQLNNGKLKELVVYDSLGIKPIRKFEIFDEYSNRYKCKYTQYNLDSETSQVYWVKKDDDINHNTFELTFLIKLKDNNVNSIYKDGEFSIYVNNNKPLIIGEYYEEDKTGEWSFYFYPQKVKLEINYDDKNTIEKYLNFNNTLFTGDFTYINEKDNIKEVRKIKNGLRNGNTEFIDISTGKRTNKVKYKDGKIKP